jgi:hypothetical protein
LRFEMPDDFHSRDTTLARLVAEALLRSKSRQAEHSSACPDAELLATYAEHALTEEETARWERHFADCSRCQKIIAVLTANDDELSHAEVERLGNLAVASSAPSALRRPPPANAAAWWISLWRRPLVWRWLVPIAGMASAAGLWFALHQAPPRETLSSQKIDATAEAPQNGAAQGETAASSPKPDETQIAQSNLPAPPALAPPPETGPRDKETASAKSPTAAKKENTQKQEAVSNAVQAPSPRAAVRSLQTREYDAKDNRLQRAAPPAEPKSEASDALSAAAPVAPRAVTGAVSAPPPPAPALAAGGERAERQDLDRGSGAPARTQTKALAQNVNPAIVFGSPNRRSLWRLGSGGRIDHSTDQGQTWQAQSSGVTADLLAGAAPSETVAWVIGRDGTILRTEDGEHWQRVAPPSGTQPGASKAAPPDWVTIEARDALHATVTSRDLRRFTTEDGGLTWVQPQ